MTFSPKHLMLGLILGCLALTVATHAQTQTPMDPDHTQLMPYYSMPGERAPLGKAVALPPVLWGAIAISPTLGWGYSNGFKS